MEGKSIIFFCSGPKLWRGGIYYLKNFLIHVGKSNNVILVVNDFDTKAQALLDESGVQYKLAKSKKVLTKLNAFLGRLGFSFTELNGWEPDIIFYHGAMPISREHRRKLVFWIPDLLHLNVPGVFSIIQKFKRRIWLKLNLVYSNYFLVSSDTMKNELNESKKVALEKILVYRFPSYAVHTADFDVDRKNLVLIPHEWWRHKNHLAILDLIEVNPSFYFVFTGNTRENEKDCIYYSFEKLASKKNLTNYRVLGAVSYDRLMELFNKAIIIVNVSLNEGWNTSVEMGKSLGKILLLSNIPVHIEQVMKYPYIVWFKQNLNLSLVIQDKKWLTYDYNQEVEMNLARFNAEIEKASK